MLKKVIIYSRHGLRYPLFNHDELKNFISPEKINWNFEGGILTPKGEILEYKMGLFLKKYLKNLNFNIETKEFYSNSIKRTFLTAKLLSTAMFPYENIKINCKYENLDKFEEKFDLKINNSDVKHLELEKLDQILNDRYNKLENILNIEKNSFSKYKSNIFYKDNLLHSDGAFKLATDIVDMFILKFYEGFPLNDIFISDTFYEDLTYLSKIKDNLLEAIFGDLDYINIPEKNCYKLLLEYVHSNNDLSVIVGHDANICTILNYLNLSNLNFGNEFEKYPVGSKLIFKIYENNSFDLDMIYYDVDTIRNIYDKDPCCISLGKSLNFK